MESIIRDIIMEHFLATDYFTKNSIGSSGEDLPLYNS